MESVPPLVLGVTVVAYWACVGAMVVRVSRRGRKAKDVLVPARSTERAMWLVWVPLIATWMALPFVSPAQDATRHPWVGVPAAANQPVVLGVRFVAAALAVACLALSIQCWRHMGVHWRMAIDASANTRLITDGPFARVRHPIYTLSIALMLCSLAVIPTPLMLVVATIHVTLMQLKARSEEAFLLTAHGAPYRDYLQRTGRFLPRMRPGR